MIQYTVQYNTISINSNSSQYPIDYGITIYASATVRYPVSVGVAQARIRLRVSV